MTLVYFQGNGVAGALADSARNYAGTRINPMLKSAWHPLAALCTWAAICLALAAYAELFNGLKPGGLPLGYWYTAQGAPLALAVLAPMIARRNGP